MKNRFVFWSAFSLALGACSATAETLTLECKGTEYDKDYAFTLTYEGGTSGTIHADGHFGKFDLTATREERTGDDGSGTVRHVVGIRGWGAAVAVMPDKAAMEACLKAKLPPEQLADPDMVYMSANGCAAQVPTAPAVPIVTNLEIAILDDADPFVTFQRTYAEPSIGGGKLSLDYMPPPRCELQ